MGEGSLYQVIADKFVAGVVVRDGRVVQTAPILRWAIGKSLEELRRQVEERGGTVSAVFARE
jgi:hypothetical protein